jgi:hypothetical protein
MRVEENDVFDVQSTMYIQLEKIREIKTRTDEKPRRSIEESRAIIDKSLANIDKIIKEDQIQYKIYLVFRVLHEITKSL